MKRHEAAPVRTAKDVVISDALTFMAGDRSHVEEAYPGDILGLHNHGTIQIGDTFTRGEMMKFTGIPNFAPELFRRIRLKDPLKQNSCSKAGTAFRRGRGAGVPSDLQQRSDRWCGWCAAV